MTHKTVDVIYSLVNGFPHILEVVDSDDIEYSIERQECYKEFYENVNITMGVELMQQNNIELQKTDQAIKSRELQKNFIKYMSTELFTLNTLVKLTSSICIALGYSFHMDGVYTASMILGAIGFGSMAFINKV